VHRLGALQRGLPAATGVAAATAVVALAGVVGFLVAGTATGSVDWGALLTSATWDPRRGQFGAAAMVWGTAATSVVALALAAPLGWAAAVALVELVGQRWGRVLRAVVEVLAVVPSIVYGLVGIAYLRPLVASLGDVPGGDGLLTAGLVLAVMILPTVVAVSVDALDAVPAADREAARALGLEPSEVVREVVLPRARRGLVAGAVLGLARALGETIAVFLVVGRADGRLPSSLRQGFDALFRPGQTLTTKLNGPESVLAGTSGEHWAALCALGLVLLAAVGLATAAGRRALRAGAGEGHRPRLGPVARGRRARDRIVRALALGALGLAVGLVVAVGASVLARGTRALDPSFWWDPARGSTAGGIREQLLGTVVLVAGAGAMAAPVGLGLGLRMGARGRAAGTLRSATLLLAGLPSILLGLFGYWLFTSTVGWGKSWLAGSAVLAAVAVPPVAVAVAASLGALPPERREAALAAGLRPHQVLASVELPHVLPGLATGLLLGLARAAGETAPILFTATVFAGAGGLPSGITDTPVVALPTHIFALAQDSADPAALDAAWGAALVLIVVAGLLVLSATGIRHRLEATRP